MNHTPAVDRPRFTCRLARSAIAILGDTSSGVPSGPGSGHVATCEDCQVHFALCDEFDFALKRDALAARQEPSPTLEQDILRTVRQATPPARRSATSFFSFALAGVAACAAAAILIFQQPIIPSAGPPVARSVHAEGDVAAAQQTVDTLLAGDPLQSEVDAVLSDAESAVKFLARNFLPASVPTGSSRNGE